ncbi:MAG: O-antigen ligase family protein, partial [Myxococcales bacterium]|nr:O-antigen ligase family protein [Myxococcales bacterium]
RVQVVGAAPGEEPALADRTPAPVSDPAPPPRPLLWRAAVHLWRERPLLGIGADNFRRRYGAVLSPAPSGQPYTDTRLHANSLYFETLADLGIAGVAALGAILVALVRRVGAHHAARDLLGFGCGLAALVFFVHGLLDYFFEFTPLFGLFWVLLGLTAGVPAPAPARA